MQRFGISVIIADFEVQVHFWRHMFIVDVYFRQMLYMCVITDYYNYWTLKQNNS